MNPTTAVLTISWLLAGVCALPQLVVFETYEVFTGWYQCTDVWQLHRYFNVWPSEALRPILLSEYAENAYNITHLIIVFWGPLLVLIVSYVFIATKLMHYSSNGKHLDGLRSHASHHEISSSNDLKKFGGDSDGSAGKVSSLGNADAPLLGMASGRSSPRLNKPDLKIPAWRRQLRSKVFRATFLVVLTHVIFWFPYNALALMKYVNLSLYRKLSDHANIFKDMQFLITLINPFLYGFSH